MKCINIIIRLSFGVIFMISCKKFKIESYPMISLTTVNAVVGGNGMKIGSQTNIIANNNFQHFTLLPGSDELYVWPVSDSLHPYYVNSKFVTKGKEMYSLFVCGHVGNTEGIIIKEDFPDRTDSTAGIRFINLSPNSNPLNITLSTSPTINEVNSLAYKQYTEFKSYSGFYNSTYTFQIRDAATPSPTAPLATFSLPPSTVPRFSNITLVIRGLVGAAPALGVTRVNNDR